MDEPPRYYERPHHDTIFDLLDEVRRRPSMFVRGIRELEDLVHGYLTALHVHSIDEGVPDMGRHFATWLQLRTGWSLSAGWAYAIRTHHREGTDPLDRFFELMDLYRQLRPVVVARATLDSRHLPTGKRVIVGRDLRMPPPCVIEVVAYRPDSLFFLRHQYADGFTDDNILLDKGLREPAGLDDAKRWAAEEFQVRPEVWEPVG